MNAHHFGGWSPIGFGDFSTFKNGQISISDHGHQKIYSIRISSKVGIDITCMHTDFGGCGLSGFGDIATFKNSQISLSDHGL